MTTTSRIGFYLAHGELGIIMPKLYNKYKHTPYTIKDAETKVEGFNLGVHLRLYNLEIVEKVKSDEFKKRPQKWRLTELACAAINRHLKGEKPKRKRIPYIPVNNSEMDEYEPITQT